MRTVNRRFSASLLRFTSSIFRLSSSSRAGPVSSSSRSMGPRRHRAPRVGPTLAAKELQFSSRNSPIERRSRGRRRSSPWRAARSPAPDRCAASNLTGYTWQVRIWKVRRSPFVSPQGVQGSLPLLRIMASHLPMTLHYQLLVAVAAARNLYLAEAPTC